MSDSNTFQVGDEIDVVDYRGNVILDGWRITGETRTLWIAKRPDGLSEQRFRKSDRALFPQYSPQPRRMAHKRTLTDTYSFCEPSDGVGRWHIRQLTSAGPRYSGGIDTASLCERVKPYAMGGAGGWDVQHEVTAESVGRVRPCPQCAEEYQRRHTALEAVGNPTP